MRMEVHPRWSILLNMKYVSDYTHFENFNYTLRTITTILRHDIYTAETSVSTRLPTNIQENKLILTPQANMEGDVDVTLKFNSNGKVVTKTITVSVEIQNQTVSVTGISFDETIAALTAGQSLQLTATVAPQNATNKNVTWTSSNTAVATVIANGLVTAFATETSNITVRTADGRYMATCLIIVSGASITIVSTTEITNWFRVLTRKRQRLG